MMDYKSDKETIVLRLWPRSIEIHSKLEFSARLGKFFPMKVLCKFFGESLKLCQCGPLLEGYTWVASVWTATHTFWPVTRIIQSVLGELGL